MITAAALTTAAGTAFGSTPLTYPAAPADPVTDKYFDIEVIDTYRPLENDTAAATKQWVEAENKVTRDYLDAIPFRGAIKQRLSQLMDYRKTGLPWRAKDGRYYFYENDMAVTTKKSETVINYSQIEKVVVTKELYVLVIGNMNIYVARNGFMSGNRKRFMKFLESRINKES